MTSFVPPQQDYYAFFPSFPPLSPLSLHKDLYTDSMSNQDLYSVNKDSAHSPMDNFVPQSSDVVSDGFAYAMTPDNSLWAFEQYNNAVATRVSMCPPYNQHWVNVSNYEMPTVQTTGTNFAMDDFSPTSSSLSPYSSQPRSASALPDTSSPSSSESTNISPFSASSHLTSPTSMSSFTPSPAMDQMSKVLLPESYNAKVDPNRLFYTSKEALRLFREVYRLHTEGEGPFIPQHMYKPHTSSDIKRYVEEIGLDAPIYFEVDQGLGLGIPLSDALHSRVKHLTNRDKVVFEGRGPSVSIRLEWPGYRQWSRQIPTKDFCSPPKPITVAKLAKNVAKCVQRFMTDRKTSPLEEDSDRKWRVGDARDQIKLDDIILVSIHHVSLGSWQPQLRLRRKHPRFESIVHPTASAPTSATMPLPVSAPIPTPAQSSLLFQSHQ